MANLVILSTISCREALHELVPEFERTSGYKVDLTVLPGPELAKRIREGTRGDVFIGPEEFSGPLIEEGLLLAGSRTAFARSGTALAVRAGATTPDISTPEKFKSVMLAAKGVSYSAGASGIHFLQALERLGILDEVKAKRVAAKPGELMGEVVARGDAEIAVQQPAELLPVSGITIIGPLPPELQQTIVYGTTAFPGSTGQQATKAFVDFVKSDTARDVLRRTGLDPS